MQDTKQYATSFDKYRDAFEKVKHAVELAKQEVDAAKKKVAEAEAAEQKAIKECEDLNRKYFLEELDTFLNGAPVIMEVFNHDTKHHKLPPENEPDKYGCRFTVTSYQKNIYTSGEYVSIHPIEEDFFDVYNSSPPVREKYAYYCPHINNIPFMSPECQKHWIETRYVPIHEFSVMEEIFQRNYGKFIDGVKEQIATWKKYLCGVACYSAYDKDDVFLIVSGQEPFYLRWHRGSNWYAIPKEFKMGEGCHPDDRNQVSYDNACKMLDFIIEKNDAYFKYTMNDAKKWFDRCKELTKK